MLVIRVLPMQMGRMELMEGAPGIMAGFWKNQHNPRNPHRHVGVCETPSRV